MTTANIFTSPHEEVLHLRYEIEYLTKVLSAKDRFIHAVLEGQEIACELGEPGSSITVVEIPRRQASQSLTSRIVALALAGVGSYLIHQGVPSLDYGLIGAGIAVCAYGCGLMFDPDYRSDHEPAQD